MSLLVPYLMLYYVMHKTEDGDVFHYLSSSAKAAKEGRHGGDLGLESIKVNAICSQSQLFSQQVLCLSEPLIMLQNISSWGGPKPSWGLENFSHKTTISAAKAP